MRKSFERTIHFFYYKLLKIGQLKLKDSEKRIQIMILHVKKKGKNIAEDKRNRKRMKINKHVNLIN